jgi:hypothetical protein
MDETYNDLGVLLSDCRILCMENWRALYAPNTRLGELFARHLRRVDLQCMEKPGGAFAVHVRILSRKVWQEERYWLKIQRVAGTYHVYRHNL